MGQYTRWATATKARMGASNANIVATIAPFRLDYCVFRVARMQGGKGKDRPAGALGKIGSREERKGGSDLALDMQ